MSSFNQIQKKGSLLKKGPIN